MKQFCVKLVYPIRLSIIMRTDIYLILAPTLGVCQYVYKTLKTLQGGLFDLLGLSQLLDSSGHSRKPSLVSVEECPGGRGRTLDDHLPFQYPA